MKLNTSVFVDHPNCKRCGKRADQLEEYITAASERGISAAEYVRFEEGTYNSKTGYFTCTPCYVKIGCPTSPEGWVTP